MHAHEHVVITDHRLVDRRVLEYVGLAVAALSDGHHRGCPGRVGKPDCAGVLVHRTWCYFHHDSLSLKQAVHTTRRSNPAPPYTEANAQR